MANDHPQPLLNTNLHSNNSTHSHNVSGSFNSTSSNLIQSYGPIFIGSPTDSNTISGTSFSQYVGQGGPVNEGTAPVYYGLQGSQHFHDQAQHRRVQSATAEYNRVRDVPYGLPETSSKEGTVCRLGQVNSQTLKLPDEMPELIEQYIRSKFLIEFPDWISMWMPSQGCKSGPIPIPLESVGPGDVGYFDKSGRFEILFNIYLSEETNLRRGYEPPKNFVNYPVERPEEQWVDTFIVNSTHHRLRSGKLEYFRRSAENGHAPPLASVRSPLTKDPMAGTVLYLPDGMVRTNIIPADITSMQGYFNLHAAMWYKFYQAQDNKRVWETKNGSLLFVTGCYKAKTWAMATFAKKRTSNKQEVRLDLFRPNPALDLYVWDFDGPVLAKTGPPLEEMDNGRARGNSQCVAIEVRSLTVGRSVIRGATESVQSFMSTLSTRTWASTIRRLHMGR